MNGKRGKLMVLVGVALAIVILVLLLWPRHGSRPADHAAAASRAGSRPVAQTSAPPAPAAAGGPQASVPISPEGEFLQAGYHLDAVLDRNQMCGNEDVRATVTATADDPKASAYLDGVLSIPGARQRGLDVVASAGGDPSGESTVPPGVAVIELVDLRSASIVGRKYLPLEIGDCSAPSGGLRVSCGTGIYRPDDLVCQASLTGGTEGQNAFAPVSYTWRLLAGPVPELQKPTTTRFDRWRVELPPRVLTRSTTDFVVEVRATDARGKVRVGRGSVDVANQAFVTADGAKTLTLLVSQDPSPVPADGQVSVNVKLSNPFAEEVVIDGATLTSFACDRSAQPVERSLDLAEHLGPGHTHLAPGAGIAFTWRMPIDDKRCNATVAATGHGVSSGLPATALWVMLTDPGSRTTFTAGEGVRIGKAMAILSQRRGEKVTRVTAWEMEELEREGLVPRAGDGQTP